MEAYGILLSYAIPGFVLLIFIEEIAARCMGKKVNRAMDTISSLSSGMTQTLKDLAGLAVLIISYEWMLDHFGIFEIEASLALYLIAFVGHDFAGYWSHRWNHNINLFWNRHIVHHSSEEFNLSCALRQSISAIVKIYFFLYIPLAIIGVPTEVFAVVGAIHLFAQFWYHTTLINKLGFLENIIVTPSHHRVHHAINEQYLDKNFSEVFIIWDKMFGTFQAELKEVPPVYGTKRPAGTWNPVTINFMHLGMLIQDAWRTNSWTDKLTLWFRPTGYRPADVIEKYPVNVVEDVYKRKKYKTPATNMMIYWSWSQLIIHNLLSFYILTKNSSHTANEVFMYCGFLIISIIAYTTLMDEHKMSIPFEFIKFLSGFVLIAYLGKWFGLDAIIPGATWIVAAYLILSLVMTFYLILIEKKPNSELSSVA